MKNLTPFPKLALLSSSVPPNFLNFRVVTVIKTDNFILMQLFIVLPDRNVYLYIYVAELDNSGN